MFNGDELAQFVKMATWVTVNDYEARLLSERMGLDMAQVSKQVEGLVVTLGAQGCEVWVDGDKTLVDPVQAQQLVDPTGCGDAFRGALLYGLERGWSLVRCCELGNRVGAHKIATPGCQNYTLEHLRPA
jgi:adenosine kinase